MSVLNGRFHGPLLLSCVVSSISLYPSLLSYFNIFFLLKLVRYLVTPVFENSVLLQGLQKYFFKTEMMVWFFQIVRGLDI